MSFADRLLLLVLSYGSLLICRSIRITPNRRQRFLAQVRRLQSKRGGKDDDKPQYFAQQPRHPDEHLVGEIPGLGMSLSTQQWAGHLPVSEDGSKFFFYWLLAPNNYQNNDQGMDDEDIPLVIWLNGGPGCPSVTGLFLEVGPFRADNDGNFSYCEGSWHQLPAYLLFIDQPVGTGLSFKTSQFTYTRTNQMLEEDFYSFLEAFFTLHADTFVSDDNVVRRRVYIAGESYAGHYIPRFGKHILDRNHRSHRKFHIPLTGVAIGNGWIDPLYQYSGARAGYGMGLVGLSELYAEQKQELQCQDQLLLSNGKLFSKCEYMIPDIVHESMGQRHNRVNRFDVRRQDMGHEYPVGRKAMEFLLQEETVLKALHVWEGYQAAEYDFLFSNHNVSAALYHYDGQRVIPEVVAMIEQDVQVLFYNGVHDMVCHHVGTEVALDNLPLGEDFRTQWRRAERSAWMVNGSVAGYLRRYRNLSYLKVLDAGHLVPMDVPDAALAMMRALLYPDRHGFSVNSHRQNLDAAVERSCVCCGVEPYHRALLNLTAIVAVSILIVLLGRCLRCSRPNRRFSSLGSGRANQDFEGENRFQDEPATFADS